MRIVKSAGRPKIKFPWLPAIFFRPGTVVEHRGHYFESTIVGYDGITCTMGWRLSDYEEVSATVTGPSGEQMPNPLLFGRTRREI